MEIYTIQLKLLVRFVNYFKGPKSTTPIFFPVMLTWKFNFNKQWKTMLCTTYFNDQMIKCCMERKETYAPTPPQYFTKDFFLLSDARKRHKFQTHYFSCFWWMATKTCFPSQGGVPLPLHVLGFQHSQPCLGCTPLPPPPPPPPIKNPWYSHDAACTLKVHVCTYSFLH